MVPMHTPLHTMFWFDLLGSLCMGKRFQTWNKDVHLRVLGEELSPFNLSNLVFW